MRDLSGKNFVKQFGLLSTNDVDDFERKRHMSAFIAKDPIRSRRQSVQQAPRSQKINVSECSKKEESLDAGRETNDIEDVTTAIVLCPQMIEFIDGIHPFQ